MRTNNRGDKWDEISGDLTRGVPKEMDNLMGRSWSKDELSSKGSLAQLSPLLNPPMDENILFAGSNDGLIHYSNNGGKTWNKSHKIKVYQNIAEFIISLLHNLINLVAYAACHRLQAGDYAPYLYKTTDGGKPGIL